MTNKFLLNRSGMSPEVTCRKGRHAIESIVSRLCLASLICLCMLTVGSRNVWGAEEVIYTLTPYDTGTDGTSTGYAGATDASCEDEDADITITWNVTGNTNMVPWRIGGKGGKGTTSTYDRVIYSKNAISNNVTKIVITHGAASSITVNSMTVIVSTAQNGGGTVTSTLTPTFAANGDVTINRPAGKDWSGKYYKINYNVSITGDKNKFLEFSQAEFYAETGSSCSAPAAPTISGTAAYTAGETITLTASHDGSNHSASTTYTWYKGADWATARAASPVQASATGSSGYTFTKTAVVGDAGTYWCEASNGSGCEAHNSTGKAITVSAACATPPTVSASSNGTITCTSATINCNNGSSKGIVKGSCDISEWGFVYGTSSNPTGNKTSKGTSSSTDVANFSHTFTGLTPGQKYYVRAYAIVNGTTYYGAETNFTCNTITVTANNGSYGSVSGSGLSWTGSPNSGYVYASPDYTITAGNNTEVVRTGNTFTITSTSTVNVTITINFEAKGCSDHNGTNVAGGSLTDYSYYGPINTYYNYSTRQILYTKTDLGLAAGKKGTIKSIYFDYSYSTAITKKDDIVIYMANSSLSALALDAYETSFTKVYEGAMYCSSGWNEIILDKSFEYDGVGNLVVIIDDNSGKYEGQDYKFRYHDAESNVMLYRHNDTENINPETSSTWASGYTLTTYRPNTKFCIQESDMPTYTVNWYVNDNVTPAHSQTTYEGATLTGIPTPTKSDCDDSKDFVGWYTSTYSDEDDAPDYVSPTTMPNGGGNYYAIFATGTPGFDGYKYIGDNVLLTEGKTYIFVTSTSAGSAYALKSSDLPLNDASGKVGTAASVTVASGSKISTENTDLEFTCTSHTTTVGEELDVLKIGSTNNTLRISGWGVGYGDARAYYDKYGLYGWNNAGETFYDVYYNSSAGNFQKMENAATRVYAYEKLTTIYSDFVTLCCTPYNVTLASSGSVTGGTFNSGGVAKACATKSVTLTATPSNGGYVFNGWTVTNSSTSANVTTTVLGAGHANDNPATMTMPDYNVTITAAFSAISGISVETAPTKTVYLEGETFDPTGLVITATYANSATVDVPYSGNEALFTLSPTTATALTTENASVSITYNGQTTSQSITVYSVTLQALDENGDAIAGGGPGVPTFTAATRGISPAADAANYKWWKWEISGAELGSAATTKGNTITNPTGNVTVTAKYRKPRTVTWLVDGEVWTPYTTKGSGTDGTAEVKYGDAWSTLTLPTDPNPLIDEGCGHKFMGWVAVPISGQLDKDDDADAISALDIMTSANQSSKTGAGHNVNNDITFYAVFADYVE